jgi:hypothetical protein
MSSIGSIYGTGSTDSSSWITILLKRSQSVSSDGTSVAGSETDTTNDQGIDGLKSKIDTAIEQALKKLDKSSSAEVIMQTIKSAVDSTLQANGIDTEAMKREMPPPPPQGSGANGPGGRDDFMSKIESLLQENGFDVDKFKSELASMQNASGSALNMFGNLSSAQGVDTQA